MGNISDGTTSVNSERINVAIKTCYNSELRIYKKVQQHLRDLECVQK